jgi:hypothetical protein
VWQCKQHAECVCGSVRGIIIVVVQTAVCGIVVVLGHAAVCGRVAVCGSVCVAVCGSACRGGSVHQSVWKYSTVQQCAAVRQCSAVRQYAAVCTVRESVWQCKRQCVGLCGHKPINPHMVYGFMGLWPQPINP